MTCPRCGGPSKVVDSRPQGVTIRRRRQCLVCDGRWNTWEHYEFKGDVVKFARGKQGYHKVRTDRPELPVSMA